VHFIRWLWQKQMWLIEVLHVKKQRSTPQPTHLPHFLTMIALYIQLSMREQTIQWNLLIWLRVKTLLYQYRHSAEPSYGLGKDGKLLGAYLNGRLKIGDLEIINQMATWHFVMSKNKVKIMAGSAKKRQIKIDEQVMELADNHLFKEMVL